ncbi:hypothetical protein SAY86_006523 [Trapa natans]|uniref:Kinesin-like protein n=1 Tax=Trapa natans TaxID=22666 RepID=A0AAN7L605_TRANT|nr:hypothetical protein SAY86_006523 [Trapa natans]
MDDPMIEILSEEFHRICLRSAKKGSEPSSTGCEQVDGSTDLDGMNCEANEVQEFSPGQGQVLPILEKVIDLSTTVEELKRQHSILSGEMSGLTTNLFAGTGVINALQHLSEDHERLRLKFLEVSSERKKLYNEVVELKGNIRVFCRCRPLNKDEIGNGLGSVIEFDPSQDHDLQVNCSDSSKKLFKFDRVFKPEDNQEAVFAQTKPVVVSVLDGYNVCIFAYGQTGTGKTFTMEGTEGNRGVNYRTLEELFRIAEDRRGIMKYELSVSILEVYNEKIKDLLVDSSDEPPKKLEIKQAAEGTQEVPGLVEVRVSSTAEVWEILRSGSRARSVGSTSANELSSRSHCLLRVTVKGENLLDGHKTRSHLWMVDLAGSERVGRIDVEGERLKESQFINKSLSALGDVISSLASKTTHIPYRNSKLTHMLQSSLGGDCKTLMLVQVSPSAADLGETLCSLNFASRVRGIENGPARKQADVSELFKYKQMVEKLKQEEKETRKLQDNLQSLQLRLGAREHAFKSLQEKVRDLEQQLAEERKMRLKQESRALTGPSVQSSLPAMKQAPLKSILEKKPPLGPSKMRLPLRRITNIVPSSSPYAAQDAPPTHTFRASSSSSYNKENLPKQSTKSFLRQPRRISIAARPPPGPPTSGTATKQPVQPRRRVSIATLRPEPSMHAASTPLHMQSSVRDTRPARYSRLFSPMPGYTTPIAARSSSSKFMGSPNNNAQPGSWKPRHPTVIALQRKSLVWSPLKLRGMMMNNNVRRCY